MGQASDQPPSTPSTPSSSWDAEVLANTVIGAAIRVHRALGPGLLESAYEACLVHELGKLGIETRQQVAVPIQYESVRLDVGYRLDLLIDDQLIVEAKCVDQLNRIHVAQLMTYLRLSRKRVGLLINFNAAMLKNGLRRIVNGYEDPA